MLQTEATPPAPVQAEPTPPPSSERSWWRRVRDRVVTWVLIGAVMVVAGMGLQRVVEAGAWIGVLIITTIAIAVLAVFGTRRRVPMKYLLPGFLLLIAFQIYPVIYTVATAFTNLGDGHRVSKEEAIDLIVASSVQEVPGSSRYDLVVAVEAGADVVSAAPVYLLQDDAGEVYVGTLGGVEQVEASQVERDGEGDLVTVAGYQPLSPGEVNARSAELDLFAVPVSPDVGIKKVGLSEAYQGLTTVTYDAASDTMVDTTTGRTYTPQGARFIATDGSGASFPQGWVENVGLANFERVLDNPTLRNGFLGILAWNIVFALLSVVSTFVLGLLVALLLNDPRLRGRKLVRSVLILPYAIPGFVTALVWSSMYNRDFGLINSLTGLDVNWLGHPFWAKVALLLANLWLGFPYMFLVCTGALQAIPAELKESAMIDGASPARVLRSITLPLLLVAVGPLLIASFAFNFNNFGLVYLLTGGGPFSSADPTLGASDILISYAFRLAFGSSGANFGFASAISIFIFVIVALISTLAFRRTAALEDVH